MNDQNRFDTFTERARKVLSLAQEESQRFNHNYIGTEHMLLGLVREGDGVAAKVLSHLGVELNKARSAVEFIVGRGERIVLGEIRLTPHAKQAIELAADEARRLHHGYIGTEHLLLGLVGEIEGMAASVLESLGVNLVKVRTQTLAVLAHADALRGAQVKETTSAAADESAVAPFRAEMLPHPERFDSFTERARRVLGLAQEEARRFNHNYIGTEHLLLGLVREGEGVGAKVLMNLRVDLNKVRGAVEFIIGRGDRMVSGEPGLTPRARKVIELAIDEARRLHHGYIGTEHVLLGLVREGEGIAAGVLKSLGVDLKKVRSQTLAVLTPGNAQLQEAASDEAAGEGAEASAEVQAALKALQAVIDEKEAAILRQEYDLAAELREREVMLRDQVTRLEIMRQQDEGGEETGEDDEE